MEDEDCPSVAVGLRGRSRACTAAGRRNFTMCRVRNASAGLEHRAGRLFLAPDLPKLHPSGLPAGLDSSASGSMPERAPGSSGAGLRRFVRRREEGGRAVIARGGRPNLHAHGARLPSLGRLWLEGAPRHRLGRPWAARAARQVGQFYAVCAVVLVCVGSCLDGRRRRAHRCVSRLMCRCACFCRCGGSPRRFCESSASALGPAASQPAREQWRAGPRSPTCVASFTVQDARSTTPPGPGRSWGADGA